MSSDVEASSACGWFGSDPNCQRRKTTPGSDQPVSPICVDPLQICFPPCPLIRGLQVRPVSDVNTVPVRAFPVRVGASPEIGEFRPRVHGPVEVRPRPGIQVWGSSSHGCSSPRPRLPRYSDIGVLRTFPVAPHSRCRTPGRGSRDGIRRVARLRGRMDAPTAERERDRDH